MRNDLEVPPLRLAIAGAAGRMGRSIAEAASGQGAVVVGGVDPNAAGSTLGDLGLGWDAPVAGAVEGLPPFDVLVDFSVAAATPGIAASVASRGAGLVVGTTGLGEAERAALVLAAERVPVVWSPNMSVGVNLLFALIRAAAEGVGEGWDAEVVEIHHGKKVDAPSGTAARIAEILAEVRALAGGHVRHGRHGQVGRRPAAEIGVHALRGGDVVGEHTVYLLGQGERLELSHRATSRSIFALGALRAARWAHGRPRGLYGMADVLGL